MYSSTDQGGGKRRAGRAQLKLIEIKPIRVAGEDSQSRSGNWGPPVSNSWNSTSNTERWERGFAALSRFRARKGHCCPERDHLEGNYRLGQWVCVQRYFKERYFKDKLAAERKQRLDAIGFVWDWRDYLWEQNFAALSKFKLREGHCCVPTNYRNGDLKLGWWVATQRRNKKIMSAERRRRLNKIGFVWSVFMGPVAYRSNQSRPASHRTPHV